MFAGQKVGVAQVSEHIWLVSFMDPCLRYRPSEGWRPCHLPLATWNQIVVWLDQIEAPRQAN